MLAPVTEARLGEEPLLALNRASWARWPAFAAEVAGAAGRSIGYRADGTLVVALDADDRAALDELAARHRVMGLEVDPAAGPRGPRPRAGPGAGGHGAGCWRRASGRSTRPRWWPRCGSAAAAAGAAVVDGTVARVTVDGRGPGLGRGARRAATTLAAGTVVLAAGCRSGSIDGVPDAARPPVRPVKGQILTLRQDPADPLLSRTVRGIVRGSSIYLVPRDDGRVVVGATVEERGWDTTGHRRRRLRAAAATPWRWSRGSTTPSWSAVRAGLRPGSPDDLPMIGPSRDRGPGRGHGPPPQRHPAHADHRRGGGRGGRRRSRCPDRGGAVRPAAASRRARRSGVTADVRIGAGPVNGDDARRRPGHDGGGAGRRPGARAPRASRWRSTARS